MINKILVIEDEPGIADNITYALSTDGYEPIWCSTGERGLDRLRNDTIALVVLDVGLPDCNGFDLCKQIRREFSIPIIFLTARADEIDRVVGLEIGADDYIVKPFSPRELSARVRAVLRRTHGAFTNKEQENDNVEFPFNIDENRHLISYFDSPLELSRYEYRILKVFIGRPGWVFSREKLMELAWDEPEMSLDRTVDAHIKTLRAKLREIKPEIDVIKTHRGVGYSLKETW